MSDFLFRYHHDDGDVDDAYMEHHGVGTLQESTQQMYEAYNRHFLGCDADDRRQSLLTNLIRLRHGLKFDEEVCRCTNLSKVVIHKFLCTLHQTINQSKDRAVLL